MKTKLHKPARGFYSQNNRCDHVVWRDIVDDFLEIHCAFNPQQRQIVIDDLEKNCFPLAPLVRHPAFSAGNRLVVCLQNADFDELWLLTHAGLLARIGTPDTLGA
ncbi:MAG: hypothetical protein H6757_01310 [Candidatus Omnitrophica bacterium]|nr:hypothetical protein [Candidatus Omnitrophota bacterium]